MMTANAKTQIVYRNDQWLVEKQGDAVYLTQNTDGTPRMSSSGYWIDARDLATAAEGGHTELLHIAEKRWVDMDLLEPAARTAINLSGAVLNYDFDKGFAEARRYREGILGSR